MAHSACCLCSNDTGNEAVDLQKTCTVNSNTSLLMLLQSCAAEEFFISNYTICKSCHHLLNELDRVRLRVKDIEDKLRSYMCKYYTSQDFNQLDVKVEERTACWKKVNSNHLKIHVKSHNTELNDLETSFDFDEVNSISEINPSLEDINLLNAEDSKEKSVNGVKFEIIVAKNNATNVKRKGLDNLRPYACTECSKTWKSLAELKNHMSSHSNERPYICEICGQAYKRRQALTVHVGMHKGINPYTCAYCKKSFTQKGALVRHTPIHTGELPFQCDLCGKRFVHHTSFNIHKLSHTGEKSHKCDVCGLLLISGSHLKRHMRVHTGEKRFSCGTCGKKFAERYNLAVHEKLHLGVSKKKKYQCHICDNVYSGQVKLQEHLFTVHQKIHCPDISEVT